MSLGFYPFLLYFLTGAVGAAPGFMISAAQTNVTGYENDFILLSVSYHTGKPMAWLQIRWNHVKESKEEQLVICTITDDGADKQFPPDGYEKRMKVIPQNGSLIIQRLKKEDSGLYRVYLYDTNQTKSVDINVNVSNSQTHGLKNSLTVDNKPLTEQRCNCSCSNSGVDVLTSAWVIFSSRLSSILIAFLVFLILRFRGRRNPRQRMSRLNKFH